MKIDNKTTVEISKRYNDVTVDKDGNIKKDKDGFPMIKCYY